MKSVNSSPSDKRPLGFVTGSPEQKQGPKHPAMEHVYKCQAANVTILTEMLGFMDLSPIPELSPILPQTLSEQEKRLKALFTEGLFPGTT